MENILSEKMQVTLPVEVIISPPWKIQKQIALVIFVVATQVSIMLKEKMTSTYLGSLGKAKN